jgi:hypothetical protein
MVKIWEIDFTSFSGSSNILYDQVGNGDLTVYNGTINKQEPLSGFNHRRGVYFSNNNDQQQYVLYEPSIISIEEARFSATYNRRSFALWIYTEGMGNSSYWDSSSNRLNIWGYNNAVGRVDAGIGASSLGDGIGIIRNQTLLIQSFSLLENGWHLIVVTIDRLAPQTRLYIDNELIGTSTSIIEATTPTVSEVIGDTGTGNEGSFYLGNAATYDHILSEAEISTMYNTFLVDSEVGPHYYQAFSGYVYGPTGSKVSGAKVLAIHKDLNKVVHSETSNSSGYYEIILPYSGTYTIIAEDGPYNGATAFPVIATSGNVYFP